MPTYASPGPVSKRQEGIRTGLMSLRTAPYKLKKKYILGLKHLLIQARPAKD
jgi:hypothetical protein